jgi:prolyl oligopeptidase
VAGSVSFRYPLSRRDSLVEVLHGTPVADPYRWLEEANAPETRTWVDAQNAFTRSFLDGPGRDALVAELTSCFNYPRTVSAFRRGGRYFYSHNPGLLDQPILFVQDGAGDSRVLLDPNQLSADGTTALTAVEPSPDGGLIAYALSEHGSDRQILRVRRADDGVDLPDRLAWVKFASIGWRKDGSGFFYLRFPEAGTVPPEDEQYFGRIYYHHLGDPQSADVLVFETPEAKEVVPLVHVTSDDRFAVITAQRGASDDAEVYLVARKGVRPGSDPFLLFAGFDAAYEFVGDRDGRLFA